MSLEQSAQGYHRQRMRTDHGEMRDICAVHAMLHKFRPAEVPLGRGIQHSDGRTK